MRNISMSEKLQQENLFKALGLFIEAVRPYIVTLLTEQARENWHVWYYESLSETQKEHWVTGIKSGSRPQSLIDFHNLKGFAIRYRDLLKKNFDKKVNNLPTWFEEIAEVRHKCQHFQTLDSEEVQRAYSNMILIMKILGLKDVEAAIAGLRDAKPVPQHKQAGKPAWQGIIPWFANVQPHMDIAQGHLDESIFAANLAEVALGNGREIYQNPVMFYSKTFFTLGLKTVIKRVVSGLNGGQDAENRVISLQTGFGGGKTHTLISLYHIARLGKKAAQTTYLKELIAETAAPAYENASIAVFTNTTNDPTQGHQVDGLHIKTLWGELAWQLGGRDAYEIVRPNDESRTAPKGLFKKVLEMTRPALILIDELADYCVAASGITVGGSTLSDQTISFIQELSQAVSSTDRCVLVATLPASVAEVANSTHAVEILSSLANRLARIGADTKPVADEEIYEVIRRRLFESIASEEEIDKVIGEYASLYQSAWTEIPPIAQRTEYRDLLRKSYPFHPELIDMFRIRWASHHDFQRTRGVLRLLASIVADLWKRQGSLPGTNALIHTSDVRFENLDALSGQLKKLYGNGYDAVISADVSGITSNAFKIDQEKIEYGHHGLTQGIAATILLASFGSTSANKGLSVEEIKLAVLKPNAFNHNSVNGALDALEANAHYLYYSTAATTSKRYWFHTKPNVNILINQTRNEVKRIELEGEILKRLQDKARRIEFFNVLVNPSDEIPEQTRLTLIIAGPQYLTQGEGLSEKARDAITRIATKKGTGERIYRNTLLFLVPTELGIVRLYEHLRDYLACARIRQEYASQLEADQKEDIRKKIEEYERQVGSAICTAYSVVIKYSAMNGFQRLVVRDFKESLDLQVNISILQMLKNEEWLLEGIGRNTLVNNNLFPTVDRPVRVKDVYEAFLRYDDKPMISGVGAVQNSLLRFCQSGELAIAAGEEHNWGQIYLKEQPPFFDVTQGGFWLVDKSLYAPAPKPGDRVVNGEEEKVVKIPGSEDSTVKTFKAITISGKVDLANYNQIFTSFIMPLSTNQVEIEIRIRGRSSKANPLTETSPQYKITKESARQLGLAFEEE